MVEWRVGETASDVSGGRGRRGQGNRVTQVSGARLRFRTLELAHIALSMRVLDLEECKGKNRG